MPTLRLFQIAGALFSLTVLSLGCVATIDSPDEEPGEIGDSEDGLSTTLYWSSSGPISGKVCVQIHEAADPHTWNDNYLCSDTDVGLAWSSAGPIAGMRCTQIHEAADPNSWNDNYLCVPTASNLQLAWSSSGPVSGWCNCVQVNEAADPYTWNDNYLCYYFSGGSSRC